LASLGHPCKFQRVSRLGSVTARHSSSRRHPNCSVEQRAPPVVGRAAITLGIGPHSSWSIFRHATECLLLACTFVSYNGSYEACTQTPDECVITIIGAAGRGLYTKCRVYCCTKCIIARASKAGLAYQLPWGRNSGVTWRTNAERDPILGIWDQNYRLAWLPVLLIDST